MVDVAQLNGYMTSNPVHPKMHRPVVERTKKPTWALDQAKALLLAINSEYRVPLIVLAMTGIRVGELLALRWINVDFLWEQSSLPIASGAGN